MLPSFLIIGAQKAATTFVQQCLAEHPDVFMAPGETSYFEDPDYHETKREEFEKLFKNASGKKAIGIKRPSYLTKQECPLRIKQIIPHAKLIVILREPIERTISAYFHNITYGFVPPEPVEKGLGKLLDGKLKAEYPRSQEIIEFSFYCKHLKRYFELFDNKQILVLFYRDILRNKKKQIQKIYRFLEVDDAYVPQQINNRPSAVTYSIARLKFLRCRNKYAFTYNKDNTRLYAKQQSLSDRIIYWTITCINRVFLSWTFSNTKPTLNEELKQRLYRIYEADILELEKLLNVKLAHWKHFPRQSENKVDVDKYRKEAV